MKCAIFDMDGTLFCTNDINYYAYKEALDKYGLSIDYDYYCKYCNGRHYKVFLSKIIQDDDIIEKIHNIKKEVYSKYLDKVIINNHLFEIINNLKNEYKIALVTTASKKNTYDILNYTKTQELFDLIITGDNIDKPKPDPEGFIKAMDYFQVNGTDCIIFEDSTVGIEAAKKTGATVFKVEYFGY